MGAFQRDGGPAGLPDAPSHTHTHRQLTTVITHTHTHTHTQTKVDGADRGASTSCSAMMVQCCAMSTAHRASRGDLVVTKHITACLPPGGGGAEKQVFSGALHGWGTGDCERSGMQRTANTTGHAPGTTPPHTHTTPPPENSPNPKPHPHHSTRKCSPAMLGLFSSYVPRLSC
jgi:hypothetical protein